MKNLLLVCLMMFAGSVGSATYLQCGFGMMGVVMLNSKTQITDDQQIGVYSWAAFQGTPERQIPNALLEPAAGELYKFQLDEGFADQNILISVSTVKDAQGALKAVVVNPQTPYANKMSGSCVFVD